MVRTDHAINHSLARSLTHPLTRAPFGWCSYRDLLDRWQLWYQRALFDIGHNVDGSGGGNVPQVYAKCNFCGQCLSMRTAGASKFLNQTRYSSRSHTQTKERVRLNLAPSHSLSHSLVHSLKRLLADLGLSFVQQTTAQLLCLPSTTVVRCSDGKRRPRWPWCAVDHWRYDVHRVVHVVPDMPSRRTQRASHGLVRTPPHVSRFGLYLYMQYLVVRELVCSRIHSRTRRKRANTFNTVHHQHHQRRVEWD